MTFKALFYSSLITTALMTNTAQAGITVGLGVGYVFGEGFTASGQLFTDNDEESMVGSIGVDYSFISRSWRPNIGAGYLGSNFYGDANLGYNYGTGQWNLGTGTGITNTDKSTTQMLPN